MNKGGIGPYTPLPLPQVRPVGSFVEGFRFLNLRALPSVTHRFCVNSFSLETEEVVLWAGDASWVCSFPISVDSSGIIVMPSLTLDL